MKITELDTPALILNMDQVEKNIAAMSGRINGLGIPLRPHGKTAKNAEIMNRAVAGQAGGITVSTLREAEYYFDNGFRDIVYAVGISPGKMERVVALKKRGADISVILDSLEQVRFVGAAGAAAAVSLPALIEIDSDGHRSGVAPESPLLTEIGALLVSTPGTELRGGLTHAGESYNCRTAAAIEAMAERERAAAVRCAERLTAEGSPCPVVSVGSTPTARFVRDLSGVTEVRAGVYLFQDLVMAGLGVCSPEELALSVLTCVIGHQREKNWIITDAGWMALSRDRGTASQAVDQGYGVVCTVEGEIIPDLLVSAVNQEHGIVTHRRGSPSILRHFPLAPP